MTEVQESFQSSEGSAKPYIILCKKIKLLHTSLMMQYRISRDSENKGFRIIRKSDRIFQHSKYCDTNLWCILGVHHTLLIIVSETETNNKSCLSLFSIWLTFQREAIIATMYIQHFVHDPILTISNMDTFLHSFL